MQKIDLCERCATEKGVSDPQAFAFGEILGGVSAEYSAARRAELTCPQCGFTHTDFKKTGRLGCPACYHTFAGLLDSLLKDMHRDTVHKGKIPPRYARKRYYEMKIRDLKESLEKAVAEEKYEEAAQIRDAIEQLQSELRS
ncbi:UvrB/UvrC motif-containing protein [Candidatus Methylacidithermus pantelleriae]|nr:UvrB/UvrC motif-containing protein [Candidatus Methylacidithermus pantelleriae]